MAMVLSIVGGVVSAIGAMQAAGAQAAAAEYNAKVAERNRIATLQQADAEAVDKMKENRRVLGSIRANIGAAGIDLAGSPLDVIGDTAIEQNLDVAKIKYNGQVKAVGFEDAAVLDKMEASSARTAGFFNAASGLLGGFTQAATLAMKSGGGAGASLAFG